MSKSKNKEIKVVVEFTDGWEERFVKAYFELYLEKERRKRNLELDKDILKERDKPCCNL